MPIESKIVHGLDLGELRTINKDRFSAIQVNILSRADRAFLLSFAKDIPGYGPGIGISTAKRGDFLQQGNEVEAQNALVSFALDIRRRTGGVFDISPLTGAVDGTKLTPVYPGFVISYPELDRRLSMQLYLVENGDKFNDNITKLRQTLLPKVIVPSQTHEAGRWISYLQAAQGNNPNQVHRDEAIESNVLPQWTKEFLKYNSGTVPPVKPLTPNSIADLLTSLDYEGYKTTAIPNIYLH